MKHIIACSKYILVLGFTDVVFTACASTELTLGQLHVGMSRDEVLERMGQPYVVQGSIKNRDGQAVEVWEYWLKHNILDDDQTANLYWVYVVDNRLAQWGRAGDWQREADRIYEMRFR